MTVMFLPFTLAAMIETETNEQSIKAIMDRLDQLIAAVLDNKSTPQIGLDVTLWNTTEVAEYFKVSYRYASEYIVTHHTFPNALRLPNKHNRKGHPRWYANEVIQWAANYQEN